MPTATCWRPAAGLDGVGEVTICSFDFPAEIPKPVKDAMAAVPAKRTPAQKTTLLDYRNSGVTLLARVPVPDAAVYAVAVSPDGATVAARRVRRGRAADRRGRGGAVVRTFSPAPGGGRRIDRGRRRGPAGASALRRTGLRWITSGT